VSVRCGCAECAWVRRHDWWKPAKSSEADDAITGACTAMARFMVWVWCEAVYERDQPGPYDYGGSHRGDVLVEAIEAGLLRLVYP
jgi:hypothetical protein